MKLYIIAGEKSGDLIGGKIINAIKMLCRSGNKEVSFEVVGGSNVESTSGKESLFPISEINMMGFLEIVPHIFKIKKLINKTAEDIVNKNIDILVTIDSPGFTYRVASKVREANPDIKLVHVVAPSVWAYKPGRAKKYAALYDHLLTLLPFEPKYFTKHGLNSTCIGHPVFEQVFFIDKELAKKEMFIKDGVKVISVTPGSRVGEIKRHMPIIIESLNSLATNHDLQVLFVQADRSNISLIEEYLSNAVFKYTFSTDRLKSFAASDCTLAKSGTNTLEISASGTPMVVGYKINPITYFFIKMVIKIKFASLVNIMAGKEIIPEYIQNDFTSNNISNALEKLLSDNSQVKEAQEILKLMGCNAKSKASEEAARIICNIAEK